MFWRQTAAIFAGSAGIVGLLLDLEGQVEGEVVEELALSRRSEMKLVGSKRPLVPLRLRAQQPVLK